MKKMIHGIVTVGLAFFFCTTTATAKSASTMELQRSIQRNMAEIETSQMELSAVKSESGARLERLENEITSLASSLSAVPSDSAEFLEMRTRFTELMVQHTIEKFKADTERKEIAQKLAAKAEELEKEVESSSEEAASENKEEINQVRQRVVKIIGSVVEEVKLDSARMHKFQNTIDNPAAQNRIRTENNNLARAAYALQRSVESRKNSYGGKNLIQQANIASMRSNFETLVMELTAELDNSEQVLKALKMNAEMQAMDILNSVIDGANIKAQNVYEVELNQAAIEKRDEKTWRWVDLTEPQVN